MNIVSFPVTSANYDVGRGGNKITGIVLHTMVGTWQGAQSRFNDPSSQVSVHYGVDLGGTIHKWVDEANTAWQAGNYPVNQTTIGIEHEDDGNYNDPVRTPQLYDASSDLVADICRRYGIPCDATHIRRHHDVIDTTRYPGGTACPDGLDTNKIISMAQAKLGEDMVPDNDHLQALFLAFRDRQASQQEQDEYIGKISYSKLIEMLNDGPERAAVGTALNVGVIAVRDNWQQQIYDLEAQVKQLGSPTQLKPGIYKV